MLLGTPTVVLKYIKSEIYDSLLRPWLLAKAGFQITIRYFYVKNWMLLATPTVVLKYIQSSALQYSLFLLVKRLKHGSSHRG